MQWEKKKGILDVSFSKSRYVCKWKKKNIKKKNIILAMNATFVCDRDIVCVREMSMRMFVWVFHCVTFTSKSQCIYFNFIFLLFSQEIHEAEEKARKERLRLSDRYNKI